VEMEDGKRAMDFGSKYWNLNTRTGEVLKRNAK